MSGQKITLFPACKVYKWSSVVCYGQIMLECMYRMKIMNTCGECQLNVAYCWYDCSNMQLHTCCWIITPDSKVHGANMGPICGRQDPGGSHVGPVNLAIWDHHHCNPFVHYVVHGLVQDCSISSALAVGIMQSCTKLSMYSLHHHHCLHLFNFTAWSWSCRNHIHLSFCMCASYNSYCSWQHCSWH